MRSLIIGALMAAIAAGPATAQGWELDQEASSFHFGSIKAESIGETHRFTEFDAHVSADGGFKLTIDLASVDTGIGIRDERMRKFLFEVADFAEAGLTGTIDIAPFRQLDTGGLAHAEISATLSLHGAQSPVNTAVTVMRLADNRIAVVPDQIIFVNAADFGLSDGVEKLRDIAGLPSISPAVPITFSLVFERAE